MRQNSRITGRICAVVALAMVTAWGIPALAPAALAESAVASGATHSTPRPGGPRNAQNCIDYLENVGYENNALISFACSAGAADYPGPAHIALAIGYALCAGGLGWAGVELKDAAVACGLAPVPQFTSGTQWCDYNTDCLNAWSGGPWVNVSTTGPETGDTHQHFMVIDENGDAADASEIVFTGSGSWSGECIGDAYNNSGYADTSLDPCALPGQSAGWGTQMQWGTSGCPSGEAWFYDAHWKGYLAGSGANGSHFYLNDASPVCFSVTFE